MRAKAAGLGRGRSGAETPRHEPPRMPPRAGEHRQGVRLRAVPGGEEGHICESLVPIPQQLGTGTPQPQGGPESGASATALPVILVSLPYDATSLQLPPAVGAQHAPEAPEFSDAKLFTDWTKRKEPSLLPSLWGRDEIA